jgi:hypothetical protein
MWTDYIEFYDDRTLHNWYNEFLNQEKGYISGIPFSLGEVERELIRRTNIREEGFPF